MAQVIVIFFGNTTYLMEQLQDKTTTVLDRYPEIMHPLMRWFAGLGPDASGLSFGCADGSELVLLSLLAPHARLLGVEIEDTALAQAKKVFEKATKVTIERSSWQAVKSHGPFDLIMANSVFCRHPEAINTADFTKIFTFEQFEEGVGQLCEQLKPGGVLMMANTNYPFETTSMKLTGIDTPTAPFNGFVPKFGRDSRKILQSDGNPTRPLYWAPSGAPSPYEALQHILFTDSQATRSTLQECFVLPDFQDCPDAFTIDTLVTGAAKQIRKVDFVPLSYREILRPVLIRGGRQVLRETIAVGDWAGDRVVLGRHLFHNWQPRQ